MALEGKKTLLNHTPDTQLLLIIISRKGKNERFDQTLIQTIEDPQRKIKDPSLYSPTFFLSHKQMEGDTLISKAKLKRSEDGGSWLLKGKPKEPEAILGSPLKTTHPC